MPDERTEEGSDMGDREDKLARAARPSAHYIFPVIVGEDGQEDFGEPILQPSSEDAIVKAMSLQAEHDGLLVVACYGPPLEKAGTGENFFYHVATIGSVPGRLRGGIPL
jgi:hypothetical protein